MEKEPKTNMIKRIDITKKLLTKEFIKRRNDNDNIKEKNYCIKVNIDQVPGIQKYCSYHFRYNDKCNNCEFFKENLAENERIKEQIKSMNNELDDSKRKWSLD